jgi:hypothetical protein
MGFYDVVQWESVFAAKIEALLEQAEQTDAAEDARYGKGNRGDELPKELARRDGRRDIANDWIAAYKKYLQTDQRLPSSADLNFLKLQAGSMTDWAPRWMDRCNLAEQKGSQRRISELIRKVSHYTCGSTRRTQTIVLFYLPQSWFLVHGPFAPFVSQKKLNKTDDKGINRLIPEICASALELSCPELKVRKLKRITG